MPACGKACTKERDIELTEGQMVCSYCPQWMIECEAINLLHKPLPTRQRYLREVEKIRGKRGVEPLKDRMIVIYSIWHKKK
jgi:hypothetical protein